MKAASLLLLRGSLGLLMLIWGADKLVNVDHGLAVSERYYLGAFSSAALLRAFGVAQLALGALVLLGVARRYAYPVLLAVTGATLLGVWKSVVDPWGWYLEGANVLFYPSLIMAREPRIVPIPRTTKERRLEENLGAVGVALTADDFRESETVSAQITIPGGPVLRERAGHHRPLTSVARVTERCAPGVPAARRFRRTRMHGRGPAAPRASPSVRARPGPLRCRMPSPVASCS